MENGATRARREEIIDQYKDISGGCPLDSKASQSPVPVGNSPIDLHFHNPSASVRRLARIYTNFWSGKTERDLGEEGDGANGAKAVLIAATLLNGLISSMNTIPMLNICTPPPDMYNIKACIGSDFAGEMARSQARFSFSATYEAVALVFVTGFVSLAPKDEKPGGGGSDFHLE